MKNIRPFHVVFDEGIDPLERQAVQRAVTEILALAGVADLMHVSDFHVWRERGYDQGGVLQPYLSVDWYIRRGRESSGSPGQLNVETMMFELAGEPWRKVPHYDLMVVSADLTAKGMNFVIGYGNRGIGAIASVARIRHLEPGLRGECIKTEIMHELGHVFGLIPRERTVAVEAQLGRHCANICIMRQGVNVPDDWIRITLDRLDSGAPFCPLCLRDLRSYFA